jgi:transcriptional regulator with XRE-family HTH domain
MSNSKPTIKGKKSQQAARELLARRIKRARHEAGLSQKELGKKLKLSDKAISSYEVARSQPTLDTLRRIGQATQRPITYFVDEVDPDNVDLLLKIKKIEQELLEIKQTLRSREERERREAKWKKKMD